MTPEQRVEICELLSKIYQTIAEYETPPACCGRVEEMINKIYGILGKIPLSFSENKEELK